MMKWFRRKPKPPEGPVFTSAEVALEMMKRDLAGEDGFKSSGGVVLMTGDQCQALLTEMFGGKLPEEIADMFGEER